MASGDVAQGRDEVIEADGEHFAQVARVVKARREFQYPVSPRTMSSPSTRPEPLT